MIVWRMQYRVRRDDSDMWGDWGDLPDSLLFSDIYVPKQFEFRAVAAGQAPAFVFEGSKRSVQ